MANCSAMIDEVAKWRDKYYKGAALGRILKSLLDDCINEKMMLEEEIKKLKQTRINFIFIT